MAIRPNKAQRFLWWFFPVAVFLVAYVIATHEGSTAYLYPHEEAKVYFDSFHNEGYESIQSATYIGDSRFPRKMPSKMKGVINGKEISSEYRSYDLRKIDPAFEQLGMFSCPDGLSAKRSDAGWVYEVTPEIKNTKHRKVIEDCIGKAVAGIYEIKKLLDIADADEIKAAQERKESWETAPKPE